MKAYSAGTGRVGDPAGKNEEAAPKGQPIGNIERRAVFPLPAV
jgi:hypothetical protein